MQFGIQDIDSKIKYVSVEDFRKFQIVLDSAQNLKISLKME